MRLKLKQLRKLVLTIAFILLFGGAGWFIRGEWDERQYKKSKAKLVNTAVPETKEVDFSLFWEIWDKLETKYLERDQLDREKMVYGAIQGLTNATGDPYTVFLPPKKNEESKEELNGTFEGVGIRLGYNEDKQLVVISPLEGMPAKAAGVEAGDLILRIKDENKGIDESTNGITLPEAVEKIRGPKGSEVTLTLLHEDDSEPYEATITRDTIVVPTVKVEFMENGAVAHLQLSRFGDKTPEQWDQAVDQILEKKTVNGVVLDLRGNPGGYMKGAINLASEFINKGVVMKQVDYRGREETYSVNRKGRLTGMPVVVLINRGSASSSEILAGALRDHQRAKLVGTRSFGKGTIQQAEDVDVEGAGLHLTTAKWLTPNGTWVKGEGLKPDVEVKLEQPEETKEATASASQQQESLDNQLEKAIEVLKEEI